MENIYEIAKKEVLEEIGIEMISQLGEISSVNRPGPLAANLHNIWVDRKNGNYENPTNEERVLELIFKRAFGNSHSGMMIFQEDVMRLLVDAADFTFAESDEARRAIGKKKLDVLMPFKQKFIDNWKYKNYYKIGGREYLPDQEIELKDGSKITVKELVDRIYAGEEIETA